MNNLHECSLKEQKTHKNVILLVNDDWECDVFVLETTKEKRAREKEIEDNTLDNQLCEMFA